MKRLGARPGQVNLTNQLDLAELDRELLRRWQERAPKDEFELGIPWARLRKVAQSRNVGESAARPPPSQARAHGQCQLQRPNAQN